MAKNDPKIGPLVKALCEKANTAFLNKDTEAVKAVYAEYKALNKLSLILKQTLAKNWDVANGPLGDPTFLNGIERITPPVDPAKPRGRKAKAKVDPFSAI
jgi:hypothetical protein